MSKFLSSLAVKITTVVFSFLCCFVLAGSTVTVVFLAYHTAYTDDGNALYSNVYNTYLEEQTDEIAKIYESCLSESFQTGTDIRNTRLYNDLDFRFAPDKSNFDFRIVDSSLSVLYDSSSLDTPYSYAHTRTMYAYLNPLGSQQSWQGRYFSSYDEMEKFMEEASDYSYSVSEGADGSYFEVYESREFSYRIDCMVKSELPVKDSLYSNLRFIRFVISLRYTLIFVMAISGVLLIASVVILLCAAGHAESKPGITLNWIDRIPLEILMLLSLIPLAIFFWIGFSFYTAISQSLEMVAGFLYLVVFIFLAYLAVFIPMLSFSARAKQGAWWKNTVAYGIGYGLVFLFRKIGKFLRLCSANMPNVLKYLLFLGAMAVSGYFMIFCNHRARFGGTVLGFTAVLILFVLGCIWMAEYGKLYRSAGKIARGEEIGDGPDCRLPDQKAFSERLVGIDDGIRRAVSEQIRSERMKTELITNVSHDIKTPLTSIINYVDLIGKEPIDNPTVREYLGVLSRQSSKLKKLIEDLIEASKASTGNLAVIAEPIDLGVLLSQTVGEYTERLAQSGLEAVEQIPPQPVFVLADGRHLWRVFENLMNNICKYALPGTRVYLSLENDGKNASVIFKNVSKEALNIPPEELEERFVRGDSSRNTEGSGLGLSIARSLTQLQGGQFEISTDGDLFKATVRFLIIDPQTAESSDNSQEGVQDVRSKKTDQGL